MESSSAVDAREAHIAELEARVAELETELHEQAARTAATVAEAQEKLYWLERWHVDLDRVMKRPGALAALEGLRRARGLKRRVARAKRRLSS